MNKRGITLVEFIVSLALVSIVMIFLFNLLLDVQYNAKHGDFAKDNQMNRASILRTVMDDFNNLGLIGLRDESTSSSQLKLVFLYQSGDEKNLIVEEKKISYGDEVWSMKSNNSTTKYQTNCIPFHYTSKNNTCTGENCSDYFSFHLRIPVVMQHQKDNQMDDLDFFYIGRNEDVLENAFLEDHYYLGVASASCF